MKINSCMTTHQNIVGAIYGYGIATGRIPELPSYEHITDIHVEDMLKDLRNIDVDDMNRIECLDSIRVLVDVTAPLSWWDEFGQYDKYVMCQKVPTIMTLIYRDLAETDFDVEPSEELTAFVTSINNMRAEHDYVAANRCLPNSFLQRGVISISYATLATMYKQQYSHKENDWQKFFDRMVLPYKDLITGEKIVD